MFSGPQSSQLSKKSLTQTQSWFVEWNADRLGITTEESLQRYCTSWNAFPNGHAGKEYRSFNDQSYELYNVFFDDNSNEVYDAYQFFGPMHFLRMLAYRDFEWDPESELVRELSKRESVSILDFGCGLAQKSRGLASCLQNKGTSVQLVCADILTLRATFLKFIAKKTNTEFTFLECSARTPVPDLPASDVVIALEFFEHAHEPLTFFEAFDKVMNPGGLLLTNVNNHQSEFMHVSPTLEGVRTHIKASGYDELKECELYIKRETSDFGDAE